MRRPLTSLRLLSAVLATALAGTGPAVPAQAGSAMHCLVSLISFPDPSGNFYYAVEGAGSNAAFHVATRSSEQDCNDQGNPSPYVNYHTEDGAALAGQDYLSADGSVQLDSQGVGTGLIRLVNDDVAEPVIKDFRLILDSAEQPWLPQTPKEAPIYIIDDDGSPRVAFRQPAISQVENRTSVRIPVFMAGQISSSIAVSFSVGGGTATTPDDYTPPSSTTLTFTPTSRVQVITFTLTDDTVAEPDETVEVTLADGTGYDVDTPGVLTLTIVDDDADRTKPRSWFHHPRQGLKYPYGDYRLREMHAFFDDGERGSGVRIVHMALRRKKMNGSCQWWNGSGWAKRACTNKQWIRMTLEPFFKDLYYRRFPPLKPSVGTRIKNYTAWCRATDNAGNVETLFLWGQNFNTFEVARR